jgi:beta-N-acetylhexosaminidase
MKKYPILIFSFLFLFFTFLKSFTQKIDQEIKPPFLNQDTKWVDSVFNTLTPDERIAQLIMVAAYSNKGIEHEVWITDLIRNYKIGGLIFFQDDPLKQAELTNFYQSQSEVPLLISMDGEWGLGMRLRGVIDFPYQMSLGAIRDDSLLYLTGAEIAAQYKRMGVHINLAPVVDINNNPENPVINFRSFGENRYNVTTKATMYMQGLQDNGILATAKHFPGHGDTDTDSHLFLPVISHSRNRLDSIELYPYRELIKKGLGAIMVAHLSIPALDSTKNLASTLSFPIVTNLLKKELDFKGLTITDAMNMKAVTGYYPPGVVDAMALVAGNDILLFTQDVPAAIEEVKKAINNGEFTREDVNKRCRKVLACKYWAGLANRTEIDTFNLLNDLNSLSSRLLNRKLTEASLTVLSNNKNFIPLKKLDTLKIASLSIYSSGITPFQDMLENYTKVKHFSWLDETSADKEKNMFDQLKEFNLIITAIVNLDQRPGKNFGISEKMRDFIRRLIENHKTIIVVFGNPYSLDKFDGIENSPGLMVTYQESRLIQEIAAQLIFGGTGASGKLPVSINEFFRSGDGIETQGGMRFNYTLPEATGMDSEVLDKNIDSIALIGIRERAFPGCQVLAARKGAVIFHKCYGYHTYKNLIPVKKTDIYDFASVTKIMGPLPALMKLYDTGNFNLDVRFSNYWPDFKRSNKSKIAVRDVLAHQARLIPWIAYWENTVKKNGKFKWFTFKRDSSLKYPVRVSKNLFIHKNYKGKIYRAIRKSPLREKNDYSYSGLSFYLYPEIIKNLTGENYENYLKQNFYQPLGAFTLTYNPYKYYPGNRIIPTENDNFFRMEQIHGDVHDEGAAMMGGVSGNAGLFGTAIDLAKLMQMYLNMGVYGGERYISEKTLKEFTRYQFPDNENRRGLGFDKPLLENSELGPEEAYPAVSASKQSFGHSGYTGIFTWVDPEKNLLYIFLSNRVYPTRENQKIFDLNIRTSILQVLYDAIE